MIIDCSVHPVLDNTEFNQEIGGPWNLLKLPALGGDKYCPPFDELALPEADAADPKALAKHLFDERGSDFAVLSPTTRGYWPNPQQAKAVAQAANQILFDRWLDAPEADSRFLGSIRLPISDTDASLREIDKWADDERFVQIVVPARALATYGDQKFFPIWQAAAERGLVVYVHDDLGTLIEPPPTQVGFPSYFSEIHALRPLSSIVHLTAFIVAGVFDRLPDLKVVLGDVSVHAARSIVVRTDKDWQSDRVEVPWMTQLPTQYFGKHVRFASQPEDEISPHSDRTAGALGGDTSDLVVYGSRSPYWDSCASEQAFGAWTEEERAKLLAGNATEFYPRLKTVVDAALPA